jgi:hypothetical protein
MSQSEHDQDLVKHLTKLWDEGAKGRDKFSQKWKRSIDLVAGRGLWPGKRPSYKIDAAMNFLGQTVMKKTAILTDSRPTIQVTSRRADLDDVCDALTRTIEAIFEERSFEQKLIELVTLEQHFGLCGSNTCFDKALDFGRGDIDVVILDPRSFVFDPFILRTWNLKSGEYFSFETTRPTDQLRDTYPKVADDIKPDFSSEQVRGDSIVSMIRSLFFAKEDQDTKSSVIPRSIVRDFWVKDRKSKKDDKLAYPAWREIVVAGGAIVEDGAGPYVDGELPFDMMEWDFNVDSAYGFNEVQKLEMPQILFNKLLALVMEAAILMGNPIWIGDENAMSAKDWERLSNQPGSLVKKRQGTTLQREGAPALPTYMMGLFELLINGMEKLSGITEVTEGRRPGQVTSGVAIEQLATAAQTIIRLKARQVEGWMTRVGNKLIPRIFQYYTEDRVFNLLGPGQRYQQYVYEREKVRTSLTKKGISILEAFKDFQFKVVPTTSLTVTKWQKGIVAMQLLGQGVLDDEEVLEVLEWPNRDRILARIKEKKATGEMGMRMPTRNKLPRAITHMKKHPESPQMGQVG